MEDLEIRRLFLDRAKEDLVGPKFGQEEIIDEWPIKRYQQGILWPSDVFTEDNDLDQEDSVEENDSEGTTQDKGTDLLRQKKPALAGLSFHYAFNSKIDCKVSFFLEFATYKLLRPEDEEFPKQQGETSEDEIIKTHWKRVPLKSEGVIDVTQEKTSIDLNYEHSPYTKLKLLVNSQKIKSEHHQKYAVTIRVINLNKFKDNEDEEDKIEYNDNMSLRSIYQFQLKVNSKDKGFFCKRPIKVNADDEDTKLSELIYRNTPEFATGHVCSVSWDQTKDVPEELSTEWMPTFEVSATSADGSEIIIKSIHKAISKNQISAEDLYQKDNDKVFMALEGLISGYGEWIKHQEKNLNDLDDIYQEQAKKNISFCQSALGRMKEGLNFLKTNTNSLHAFKLANEAMQMQFSWKQTPESKDKLILNWRPFQLGFFLITLCSVSDRDHEDRDTFDLLWFPTGGGKTEAYLLSVAYLLFYLRLSKPKSDFHHVNVFMRYTLRALTEQQFVRASSMIMACNVLRKNNETFGSTPFSVGMWVGNDAIANKYADALKSLRDPHSINSPKKISSCPCCKDDLQYKDDYHRKSVLPHCVNEKCALYGELSILTVDEHIYKEPPSLLIGTVDKFAQLVFKTETKSLFNKDFPPELILQDELHLITGPLGTLVGILELAIDELCKLSEKSVKIIGSTATIRRASSQVRRVFARQAFQFPPPAIDSDDSGFAVADTSRPGRLYVGLTSVGSSEKTIREYLTASLMQSTMDDRIDDEKKDFYSTLVSYFGSLRILGGALVGIQEATSRWITALATQRNEKSRDRSPPKELTSRVASTELNNLLTSELLAKFDERRHVETVLATNMISVGVDVPRLNLMSINGQPKSMTEYIQASSRVGRDKIPGLVFTLYNHARIRDKSFYESFQTWHSSLYRAVEAITVTPFAPRALEKTLHQAMFILYRHRVYDGSKGEARLEENSPRYHKLLEFIKKILDRVEYCQDADARKLVKDKLEEILVHWINLSKVVNENGSFRLKYVANRKYPWNSLLVTAEEAAVRKALGRSEYKAFSTPQSVRNVEASSHFQLISGKPKSTDSQQSNNNKKGILDDL